MGMYNVSHSGSSLLRPGRCHVYVQIVRVSKQDDPDWHGRRVSSPGRGVLDV